jgi:hypothetical protein
MRENTFRLSEAQEHRQFGGRMISDANVTQRVAGVQIFCQSVERPRDVGKKSRVGRPTRQVAAYLVLKHGL